MNPAQFDVVLVGLGVLAGLGVIAAFRSCAHSASRVARQTQHVTRMGGNLVRALGTAAVIVGMQWAVVSLTTDPRAWGVAFGVPAIFAGSAIARLFSVTDLLHDPTYHRGTRR